MIIRSEGNNMYLQGTIYSGDDLMFEMVFTEIEAKYSDIKVFIHTNGGDVFSGNYMQNRLKASKLNVEMTNQGVAFSMGSYILLSAGKRKMARNGFIMIHPSSAGGGTEQTLKENTKVVQGININFAKDLKAVTGQSDEVIAEWLSKDTYFTAEEALAVGLIHEIIDPFAEIDVNATGENAYLQFTALFKPQKQNLNTHTMKQPLITAMGLTSVTAESSDTAVIGAVQAHYGAKYTALEQKYNAEKQAHNALKDANKVKDDSEITALLAPLATTLKKEQIDGLRTVGQTSGIVALKNVLSTMQPRTPVADLITGAGGDASVTAKIGWNWDKYQAEAPAELEAMQKNNFEVFNALYKTKFNKDFPK